MGKGVLYDYTRGSDGLYHKVVHFGSETEIITRDAGGYQTRVVHLAEDLAGNVRETLTEFCKNENVA